MLQYQQNHKTILEKRSYITRKIMRESPNIKSEYIQEISGADIETLFTLYDQVFLDNVLRDGFPGKFRFSLSKRMTKSAGLTLCPKNIGRIKPEEIIIEIRIGINFFLQYHFLERDKKVCGIESKNALEALQLVLEHEICHVLEFIQFHQSSCKGKRFKALAKNIFGHTSSYHELPSNRELAKEQLGLQIGDTIFFDFKKKTLQGIIYDINKRATVMVVDHAGAYIDKQGKQYSKYYVPLGQIRKNKSF